MVCIEIYTLKESCFEHLNHPEIPTTTLVNYYFLGCLSIFALGVFAFNFLHNVRENVLCFLQVSLYVIQVVLP